MAKIKETVSNALSLDSNEKLLDAYKSYLNGVSMIIEQLRNEVISGCGFGTESVKLAALGKRCMQRISELIEHFHCMPRPLMHSDASLGLTESDQSPHNSLPFTSSPVISTSAQQSVPLNTTFSSLTSPTLSPPSSYSSSTFGATFTTSRPVPSVNRSVSDTTSVPVNRMLSTGPVTSTEYHSLPVVFPTDVSTTGVKRQTARVHTQHSIETEEDEFSLDGPSPMEEARRQNARLRAAYDARIQSLGKNSALATNLRLSLSRRCAENVSMAQAKQQAIRRKRAQRHKKLLDDAIMSLQQTEGMSRQMLEWQQFYLDVLEFEKNNTHLLSYRERLHSKPKNETVIETHVQHIFSLPKHPLAVKFHEYRSGVADKLHKLLVNYQTTLAQHRDDVMSTTDEDSATEFSSDRNYFDSMMTSSSVRDGLDDTLCGGDDDVSGKPDHDATDNCDTKVTGTPSQVDGAATSGGGEDGDGDLLESVAATEFEYDTADDSAFFKSIRVHQGHVVRGPKGPMVRGPQQTGRDAAGRKSIDDQPETKNEANEQSKPDTNRDVVSAHNDVTDACTGDDTTQHVQEPLSSSEVDFFTTTADFGLSVASAVSAVSYDKALRARSHMRMWNSIPLAAQRELQAKVSAIGESVQRHLDTLQLYFVYSYEDLNTLEGQQILYACLERLFYEPIWSDLLNLYRALYRVDVDLLREALERHRRTTLADFGAAPVFCLPASPRQPHPYVAAVEALRKITDSRSPNDALLACLRAVQVVEVTGRNNAAAHGQTAPKMSTDDLLPVMCFAVAQAQLPDLVVFVNVIDSFISSSDLAGEGGFSVTTVQCTLNYLSHAPKPEANRKSAAEFEKSVLCRGPAYDEYYALRDVTESSGLCGVAAGDASRNVTTDDAPRNVTRDDELRNVTPDDVSHNVTPDGASRNFTPDGSSSNVSPDDGSQYVTADDGSCETTANGVSCDVTAADDVTTKTTDDRENPSIVLRCSQESSAKTDDVIPPLEPRRDGDSFDIITWLLRRAPRDVENDA